MASELPAADICVPCHHTASIGPRRHSVSGCLDLTDSSRPPERVPACSQITWLCPRTATALITTLSRRYSPGQQIQSPETRARRHEQHATSAPIMNRRRKWRQRGGVNGHKYVNHRMLAHQPLRRPQRQAYPGLRLNCSSHCYHSSNHRRCHLGAVVAQSGGPGCVACDGCVGVRRWRRGAYLALRMPWPTG